MTIVVLDASAILAVIQREPGGEEVLKPKLTLLVSTVNVAEVRSKLVDRGFEREAIDKALSLIDMETVSFDAEQAILSSDIRLASKTGGLSLGDRCCVACAIQRGGILYTTDKAWAEVDLPVEVKLLR
jgi:ribonuclease VapC